jgi:hypothetical protein
LLVSLEIEYLLFLTEQAKCTPYKFADVPELQLIDDPETLALVLGTNGNGINGDNNNRTQTTQAATNGLGSARARVHQWREALKQQRENLQLMIENVRRIDGRLECAEGQLNTQTAVVTV